MYEVRRCHDTWMMCDGKCKKCDFNATMASTGTRIIARWNWNLEVRCSNCNYKLETTGLPMICPRCGADMRGKI